MAEGTLISLGKYETRGIIGSGAVGTVYEGWDPVIARKVAIKTVRLPDPSEPRAQDELLRFRREAQAAGRLSHPNIVTVFDYGETATLAYIVMEFVDGQSLKSLLDSGERLPVDEIARIMQELLAGLQFSHDHGVVHRDIKPGNVILTGPGSAGATISLRRPGQSGAGTVKIADFGIARIESSSMTMDGDMMGTPAYMSPEQIMGRAVDPRTDIYSAGIVLYQMLAGERPFEGNYSAILQNALNTVPPPPSMLSIAAPPGLDAVVARAIAKRPDERFDSAAAFAEALQAALRQAPADDGTLFARPGTGPAEQDRTIRHAPPRQPKEPALQPASSGAARDVEETPGRVPLFIAVGLAAVIAVGGGVWFALRPVERAQFAKLAQEPNTPFPATTTPAPGSTANNPPPRTQTQQTNAADIAPPPQPGGEPEHQEPPTPPIEKQAMNPLPPQERVPPPTPPRPALSKPDLAAALAAVPCSLIGGDLVQPGDTIALTGLVGKGDAETQAHRAVAAVAPDAALAWHVAAFDAPYCRVLDLLRSYAARFGTASSGFAISLSAGAERERLVLHEGALITLRATMPDFAAQLSADYFQHDGSVFHMHPTASDGPRLYPAGSRQSFGDPGAGGARWEVGPPYGTDLIVAIASAAPLLGTRRAASEDADAYLRDLQAALEAAYKRGTRIVVSAIILDTVQKK